MESQINSAETIGLLYNCSGHGIVHDGPGTERYTLGLSSYMLLLFRQPMTTTGHCRRTVRLIVTASGYNNAHQTARAERVQRALVPSGGREPWSSRTRKASFCTSAAAARGLVDDAERRQRRQ
jgi:hypothetical protein